MSLIVYGAALSPFVRKVRLSLAHKQLPYRQEVILPTNQPDWYRELSPLGRIPALRDGELGLADSSVICQYLDEQYPETASLLGENATQRAQVRWLEKYADYELAPLCTFSVFRNRALKPTMGQACNEAEVQATLNDKLPPHFDYLERTLGAAPYFVGEQLSLADLAIACQLINMAHGGEMLDEARWPNLAAHYARIRALPDVEEVVAGEQRMLARMKPKTA